MSDVRKVGVGIILIFKQQDEYVVQGKELENIKRKSSHMNKPAMHRPCNRMSLY